MPDVPPDHPKIIVDEDWKTQVQREKETLEGAQRAQQPAGAASTAPSGPQAVPLPPATLDVLVTMLATQAAVSLGQAPNHEGRRELRLDEAKHFIDLLEMLQTKTAGNLTPAEGRLLTALLHELRMAFVSMQAFAAQSAAAQAAAAQSTAGAGSGSASGTAPAADG